MAGKEKYNVAVVGATGAVGREMLEVLHQRAFPVAELRALASARSAGASVPFGGRSLTVGELTPVSFKGIDIALFSAGASVSREFAPRAAAAGAWVVDNTSHFRMFDDVPLVVPEVNAGDIAMACRPGPNRRIVANPNCSTIQMVVALKPLHDAWRIKRIVVSTYQAVSGAGAQAMEELSGQCIALFNNKPVPMRKFPRQIAFNLLPHIDVFLEDGGTKEEWKMIVETRKILHEPDLPVSATCVRVPVFCSHSESINVELERPCTAAEARTLLAAAPGVQLADDPAENIYPVPLEVTGTDPVHVGRIRRDPSVPHGLNLWVVADNLRKGAALNAVQIAERLIGEPERYLN